jgi:hypothetical protein
MTIWPYGHMVNLNGMQMILVNMFENVCHSIWCLRRHTETNEITRHYTQKYVYAVARVHSSTDR